MLIVVNLFSIFLETLNSVVFKFLLETKGLGLFRKMRETAGIHFH